MSRSPARQASATSPVRLSFTFDLVAGQRSVLLQSAVSQAGTLAIRALEGEITVLVFDQTPAEGGKPKVVALSEATPAAVLIGRMIVVQASGQGPIRGEATVLGQ